MFTIPAILYFFFSNIFFSLRQKLQKRASHFDEVDAKEDNEIPVVDRVMLLVRDLQLLRVGSAFAALRFEGVGVLPVHG